MNATERPRRSESEKLRNLLRFQLLPLAGQPKDSVAGWDETQGYPDSGAYGSDTVGLSWGDVGHGLNLALNPVAQYHALQRHFGGGGGTGQQRQAQRRLPGPPMIPPGQAQAFQTGGPAKLLGYMGLGKFQFTNGLGLTTTLLSQEPSTAFRIRRLIVSTTATGAAPGILVTCGAINVSGMPQSPAPNAQVPITMFAGDSTYSLLDLQIAAPGVPVELPIFLSSVPASTDVVNVAAGVYGEWLR
jgi:hypothetical protein